MADVPSGRAGFRGFGGLKHFERRFGIPSPMCMKILQFLIYEIEFVLGKPSIVQQTARHSPVRSFVQLRHMLLQAFELVLDGGVLLFEFGQFDLRLFILE